MKVELLARTPNAIQVVFTAIRTCYSPYDQGYLWNKDFEKYQLRGNDHLRLIKHVMNHGHTSTFEHVSFTFGVSDVSRSLLAQLTRHRIGFSYSVQSQRYVNHDKHNFGFVVPPNIKEKGGNVLEDYQLLMEKIQNVYSTLVEKGVKPEDARYVLPNAATTNITVTMNLRAILDFYSKRNSLTHAQWEIATLTEQFRKLVKKS